MIGSGNQLHDTATEDPRSDDVIELLVEWVGAQGEGVARYEGEAVFLPFTAPGDRVVTRLGARRGNGREGRVVEWLATGPGRSEPLCRHFGECGGCALQYLDSASYRAAKLGMLLAALERTRIDSAGVEPLRVVPPAGRRVPPRAGDPDRPIRLDAASRARCGVAAMKTAAFIG